MLKKTNRLKSPLIKKAKTNSGRSFILKVAANNVGRTRVAILVSKNVDKKAVVRNKIKRMIADAIYNFVNNSKKEMDLVIIAKKEILYDKKEKVTMELGKALAKI